MASPIFFAVTPTATTVTVEIRVVGGTGADTADFQADFSGATFVTFSGTPAGWQVASNPSGSSVTVSMADFNSVSAPVAPTTDGVLGVFTFNRVAGASDFVFSLSNAALSDVNLNDIPLGTIPTVDVAFLAAVGDAASATEAGGVNNAIAGVDPTGNVLTNDKGSDPKTVDSFASVSETGTLGVALAGAHGSLTLAGDGSYTYVVDQKDAQVAGLNVGGSLTDTFTYVAKDTTTGETSSATLTVTINGVDDAPVAPSLGDQTGTFGTPVNFTASAFADPDDAPGTITYAATLSDGSPLPTWLSFDGSTRTFSGTPPTGPDLNLSIKVTATDPSSLSASALFNLAVTCFAPGTRIATKSGDVAVENLKPGDKVRTMIGGPLSEVRRIRHRSIDCTRHPNPQLVWPVRITAGAFAAGIPSRDLVVSPDHAIYAKAEGVLIPAKYLVNDTTIRREPVDRVEYYHVQLDRHDVLIAEGLTAESYLDIGDASAFDASGQVVQLHPDLTSRMWEAVGCAPLVVTGHSLDTVTDRLARRAAKVARTHAPAKGRGKRRTG